MLVASRLVRTREEPFALGGDTHRISVSVGVAFVPDGDAIASDLLRDADTAMYRAKAHGRARFEVADGEAVDLLRA